MADTAPNFQLGEIFKDNKLHAVEYAGTIEAGDPLMVTGGNSDSLPRVQKQTGSVQPRYVAAYAGKSGYITDAIFEGTTKILATKKWSAGGAYAAKAGNWEVQASGASKTCGFGIKGVAADGDSTLVYFHGVVT